MNIQTNEILHHCISRDIDSREWYISGYFNAEELDEKIAFNTKNLRVFYPFAVWYPPFSKWSGKFENYAPSSICKELIRYVDKEDIESSYLFQDLLDTIIFNMDDEISRYLIKSAVYCINLFVG